MNTRRFYRYAALGMLGSLGLSCYVLADTLFIARAAGKTGLAALNLALPGYSLMFSTGLMTGTGGAALFAIARASGEEKRASEIYTVSVKIAALFSALFFCLGLFFSRPFAQLLGAQAAVLDLTDTYLKTILLFGPGFVFNDLYLFFIRNDGAPHLATAAQLIGSGMNIVLDYLFIFPCGLGVFGAALATGLSPLISLAVLSLHARRGASGLVFSSGCSWRYAPRITAVGFPAFITQFSSGVVMLAFNRVILTLAGTLGVAAYSIVINLEYIATALYSGLSQGIQPLLSAARGRSDWAESFSTLRLGIVCALLMACAVYTAVYTSAPALARAFNTDGVPGLSALAAAGLKIYFLAVFFSGQEILYTGFFTALAEPKPAHLLTAMRGFLVILPLLFLFAARFGMTGVWAAYPVSEAVTAAVGALFIVHKRRILKTDSV